MPKIAFISDTHSLHRHIVIEPCDIIIHCGDVSNVGLPYDVADFLKWFKNLPASKKIFIAGNHDRSFDKNYYKTRDNVFQLVKCEEYYLDVQEQLKNLPKDVIYLQDGLYETHGLKIYGSPYTPSFYRENWAFNADRGSEISEIWREIPDDVDILVTHGPPKNILDVIPDEYVRYNESKNVGCQDLLNRIKQLKNLKIACFGHIHDNFAVEEHDGVKYINAAVLDNRYRPITDKPIYIEL